MKISKKEIWRDIKGYQGIYQVSNKGRVKSLNYRRSKEEHIMKVTTSHDGYLYLTLYKKGYQNYYPTIHRLVFQTFVRPLRKGEDVHHLNENKLDNRVENLIAIDKSQHLSVHKKEQHTTKDPVTGRFIKENKE